MSTTSFASIRLITDDVSGMVSFYERVTGVPATWANDLFAELTTERATLAIASTHTLAILEEGIAEPGANRSAIIEFLVPDVDADFARIDAHADVKVEVAQEPTTMPWGNRSLLLRDPDGNLVNLFTPLTPESIERSRKTV